MDTKLTLKLNKKVIEKAKIYAKKNNKSLSELIENYFRTITDDENKNDIEISPNVMEISGIIKLPENFKVKEMYGKYIEEKYSR